MPPPDPGSTIDSLTTEEAFALIGDEVRQQILMTLSEPDPDTHNTQELAFSELYDRVDAAINTSQFNYHLQQLEGHFIEARDDDTAHLNDAIAADRGYALRPEGLLLLWTIRSATTATDTDLDPFPARFDCHHCDTPVEARYEHAIFNITCPDCGYHYEYNLTPPGILAHTDDDQEILDRVATYNRTHRSAAARGGCPLCGCGMERSFLPAADTNYPRADLRTVFLHHTCPHCGYIDYLTVGEFLRETPALTRFCLDHDIPVLDAPAWELPFIATDTAVTIDSRDPWRVSFALTRDDASLSITIDETFSTTATRSP